MTRNSRSARFGLTLGALAFVGLPLMLGQGCPTGSPLENVVPRRPVEDTTGNVSPTFQFIQPSADVSHEVGDVVTISWTDSDPDSNAAITLLADPDNVFGNGNERVILALVMEDDPVNSFDLDTSSLPPAIYRLVAKVNDNVNPELVAVATGRLLLFGRGLLPGNISPTVSMVQPMTNVALSHGETTEVAYCGRDPDDGPNDIVPDVIILLDTDQDPTNDIDLTGPDREQVLFELCGAGGFPREVNGIFVFGCAKDDDCAAAVDATEFALTVDVSQVPPRASGEPYWPRVTMWDHTNPPVHAYSPGNISITALGSGTIDLVDVGRTVSGTRFLGFDAGAMAGSTGLSLGDFDGDGADDFIVVARFGRPFERGNVGSAYLVYGIPGGKFGSEINLNSVGTTYRGTGFAMGVGFNMKLGATEGIVSVATINDLNGDGRPEILFGMPYVEGMYDYFDDDPADGSLCCYGDLLPNPLSTEGDNDDLTNFDIREGTCPIDAEPDDPVFICSNDLDLTRATPIDQGYVIYVHSDNPLENTIIDLPLVGQHDPGGIVTDEGLGQSSSLAPTGARFRGGWYLPDDFDQTQAVSPFSIIPDNEFGRTVNSMPDMTNGDVRAARDGEDELLISAPNSYDGRGAVHVIFGQEYSAFGDGAGVNSIPNPRSGPYPNERFIKGHSIGDRLGYAGYAGDFNLDGNPDILMGAPGADRQGVVDGGIVYILFGRLDLGHIDLAKLNPPRVEIRGTNSFDRFGEQQTLVGDLNQDGLPDIGFASQFADGPGGVDSGFIGIVFGGRRLTGENIFTVGQVGTSQLPGVKIYGTQSNGRAGATINNAGDFNGDGTEDLLISAPGEFRTVNGQQRLGVAYVIFGGAHLYNGSFNLSQVGTAELPGVVLISPYAAGSADEAPIDWIGAAGDVNGDGFDDILVGVSLADFVNPLEPGQRRPNAGEAYLIYGNNTGSNRVRQ